MQWDHKSLSEAVRPYLKESRYIHTLGCCEMALALAEKWGCDSYKTMCAALLHDITKKLSDEEQLLLCQKYGIINGYRPYEFGTLIHADTAAALAGDIFGMPEDVVNAIARHTLGAEDMTLLDKIVFLSDAIEKGRDYPGVEDIRQMAFRDLDKAVYMSLVSTVENVRSRGKEPNEQSMKAAEAIKRLINIQENNMNETNANILEPKALLEEIIKIADSRKARNIVALHVTEQTTLADYMVMMTGTSTTHIRALSDEIEYQLKTKCEVYPHHIEGMTSNWILLDYTTVVVHVFMEDSRELYDLERMWGDSTPVDISGLITE